MSALETLHSREVRCDALCSTGDELLRSEFASTHVISGYLSCGGDDAIAAFAQLPKLIRVRGSEHFSKWMHASITYFTLALAAQRPPSTLIAERILEIVLFQALRQHLNARDVRSSQLPPSRAGTGSCNGHLHLSMATRPARGLSMSSRGR